MRVSGGTARVPAVQEGRARSYGFFTMNQFGILADPSDGTKLVARMTIVKEPQVDFVSQTLVCNTLRLIPRPITSPLFPVSSGTGRETASSSSPGLPTC